MRPLIAENWKMHGLTPQLVDIETIAASVHAKSPAADMLMDAGTTSVIVGHSERRQHHQETSAMVAAKARAAWQSGLSAIICIGETDVQRRNGDALAVCGDQIAGRHRHVRTCLTALAGEEGAAIRILYGGSVTSDNAHEILGRADVAGVLIGGASLKAADFDAVLRSVPAPAERPGQHPM